MEPLTESDLNEMEQQFALVLPGSYKKLVLDPPEELVQLLDWSTRKDTESETMLFRSADTLAGTNEWVRDIEDDFQFDPNDDSVNWPKGWFAIGGDIGGNLYVILPPSDAVYRWYQGTTELELIADNIPAYIRAIFGVYADLATMDFE